MGEILQKYDVNGKNVLYIIVIKNGLIVYFDWKLEIVIVINDNGFEVWKY